MSDIVIVDQQARQRAIDPAQSFCVTAPAGSGKTELLTQRFLKLLGQVERPEQILALTFTRKAAAEMRERIVAALQRAANPQPPEQAHQRQTWQLASAALQNSETHGWSLLDNPGRLRVQTLDSLCQSIVREQPVLSGAGGRLQPLDDATELYQRAIDSLFVEFYNHSGHDKDKGHDLPLDKLLAYFDNSEYQLRELLAAMLPFRDQWLSHAGSFNAQQSPAELLQAVLERRVEQVLGDARTVLANYESTLVSAARFAAEHIRQLEVKNPADKEEITALADLSGLPAPAQSNFLQWRGLLNLLFTKSSPIKPRQTLNKNQGFPAKSFFKDKDQADNAQLCKEQLLAVCTELADNEHALAVMQTVRSLPIGGYEKGQLELLKAMVTALIRLVAHLKLVFQQSGDCDHLEISSAALQLLDSQQQLPAMDVDDGIAYRWSQKFHHILVDEFQDTSLGQYQLLQALSADWRDFNASQPDAPKTLFLVGDGMQSIYSFRAAKVGLFIKARDAGIGDIMLEPLYLQQNFRSTATIVNWVNQHFGRAFPAENEVNSGAVSYASSEALVQVEKAAENDTSVELQVFCDDPDGEQEAQEIVRQIQHFQLACPQKEIAILVRARSHLQAILPELKEQGIAWEGVDIDPLSSREAIMDCMSLTAAMLDPSDDLHWYALLRSPLCGLKLVDLQQLSDYVAGQRPGFGIAELLTVAAEQQRFCEAVALSSEEEQRRFSCFAKRCAILYASRGVLGLRQWIQRSWELLAGESCAIKACSGDERGAVRDYLDLLEQLEQKAEAAGRSLRFADIERGVERLFAASGYDSEAPGANDSPAVKIMTIHRSKGLEFDFVVLPRLQKGARSEDKPLLISHDYLFDDGSSGVLLYPRDRRAPIEAENRGTPATLYEHLRSERKRALNLESTRLFYVAATRARSRLLLTASLDSEESGDQPKAPARGSLLEKLWPTLSPEVCEQTLVRPAGIATGQAGESQPGSCALFKRLELSAFEQPWPVAFSSAASQQDAARLGSIDRDAAEVAKTGDDSSAIGAGLLMHELLELFALTGLPDWQRDDIENLSPYWQQRLLALGVEIDGLSNALARVQRAVRCLLDGERAAWLFDSSHRQAEAEWRLLAGQRDDHPAESVLVNQDYLQSVIDRSFIDSDNHRWIIDYKLAEPFASETVEAFLQRQQSLYGEQLARYRRVVEDWDQLQGNAVSQTRCGLYFPLLDQLYEIEH